MNAEHPAFASKRACQIITVAEGAEEPPLSEPGPAARRVQVIKDLRDQFDNESPQVGLRDSTWLVISALVLGTCAWTWGHPTGLDLFARLIVVGGGVTMAVAVFGRNFLVKH
jgi:hypothetical protein